ncbi:MAG: SAM-dependent methyltransferase [Dehalococcoidia bacterium]
MAQPAVPGFVAELISQVELAAALALVLGEISGRSPVDERLAGPLADVLQAAGLDWPLQLPAAQAGALAGLLRATLAQATHAATQSAPAVGWSPAEDELLLDQGAGSATFPPALARSADSMPGLREAMAGPGARFLDVGAGVGALSFAAARTWPAATVVGLDPWDRPLDLARKRLDEAGLADRVSFVTGGIETFASDPFDLVWLPLSFIPPAVRAAAIDRTLALIKAEGWLVASIFAGPGTLGEATARLRSARSGGSVMSASSIVAELEAAGFRGVRVLPAETWPPAQLIVGRR